ncbi:hypothetical protein ACHAWF_008174, partial [Thalassiosira exigua]
LSVGTGRTATAAFACLPVLIKFQRKITIFVATMIKAFLFVGSLLAAQAQDCKEVKTVENFDIKAYASAKWFVHQQAETLYLPNGRDFCVTAEYSILEAPTFWGYTVGVRNSDRDEQGDEREGDLCAYNEAETPSKLAVAPCFLPKIAAGPYWVVAYDEAEGYALVSGGQPKILGENGGCKTGRGVNNSGAHDICWGKVCLSSSITF